MKIQENMKYFISKSQKINQNIIKIFYDSYFYRDRKQKFVAFVTMFF